MMNWTSTGCMAVIAMTPFASGQIKPVTLTLNPIGGGSVTGNQIVAVEILFTANELIRLEGGSVDVPCVLPGMPGSTGSMQIVPGLAGFTADPDNDGLQGPSSGGFPHLFGASGLVAFAPATCLIANTPACGQPPVVVPAGATRYVATLFYQVSECATGEYSVDFECTDQPFNDCPNPPTPTNTTRWREDEPPGPALGLLLPLTLVGTSFHIPTGICCDGSNCLVDGLNESCCLETYPGSVFEPNRTCAKILTCCVCTDDASCDDGQFCNGIEHCSPVDCSCGPGIPPICPPGADPECAHGICDPEANGGTGGCIVVPEPNGTPCGVDTDSECDHPDICLDGLCQRNFKPDGTTCGDPSDSPCDHADSCHMGACCSHRDPDGTPCDDGSECTFLDTCADGICVVAFKECGDQHFCNGEESCDPDSGCMPGVSPCAVGLECMEETDECLPPPIPTTSTWGLLVIALGLLTSAKLRKRPGSDRTWASR